MGILSRMKEVSIGDLDRQITVHSLSYTTGAAGEQVPGAETTTTAWAKVDYNFGDEDVEAGRQEMNSRVTFTIRYFTGITNKHWIEYESERHDIIYIEELGRQRFHVLLTEKRI